MKEHSIIYREPGACWSSSSSSSSSSSLQQRRHRRDVNSGHVYNLWPFTNITAQVRVLNAKYEGPPSPTIAFMTAEGGKLTRRIVLTSQDCCIGLIAKNNVFFVSTCVG